MKPTVTPKPVCAQTRATKPCGPEVPAPCSEENEATKEQGPPGVPQKPSRHPPRGPVTAPGSQTHRPWNTCCTTEALLRLAPWPKPKRPKPCFPSCSTLSNQPLHSGPPTTFPLAGRKAGDGGARSPTHRTDYRGSLAGPSEACSCLGRPVTEAEGRPEVLPRESQVEEGPPGGRTDPVVGVEARSQNLHTNRRESHRHSARPLPAETH